LQLPGVAGPFARPDAPTGSIFGDGSAAVIDYKTGRVPSKSRSACSLRAIAAQAAMLVADGFNDARASRVRELHIKLTGGDRLVKFSSRKRTPPRKRRTRRPPHRPDRACDNERQGYRSREMPERVTDKGDYDHLARVAEWSRVEDDE
jgi:ATP-dependent helicase/nuclease subunit B